MGKIRPKDLENGVASPGANHYYGTNGNGEVGFHQVPGASESSGEVEYIYGENISAGKLVFFGDGTYKEKYRKGVDVFYSDNIRGNVGFGNAADRLKYRVKFDMPSETKHLSSVVVPITKNGTGHNGDYYIYGRIVTLNGDLVKESNRVQGNQFVNGHIVLDFSNVKLNNETYWFEIVSATNNGSNHYTLYLTSNQDYAAGTDLVKYGNWRFDGSVWIQDDNYRALAIAMNFSIPTETGKVYECNSSMIDTCIPNGITLETKSEGETGKVMIAGVATGLSGLSAGLTYKLNSDIQLGGSRWSRADIRFNYNASENKIADIFTCNFSQPISKLFMYIHCNNNTISNKLVAKIVTLDDLTGMPSETLVDENAIASVPYANLVNNAWQAVIFKFNGEFTLTPNKKYALVLECDGILSTAGYITTRYDNSTGTGSMYKMVNGTWTFQNAVYSLAYSFIYGDSINLFQSYNLIRNPNNGDRKRLPVGEANNAVSANRFMVSVPTKIKSLTWCSEESGVPVTDMKVRIETNRLLTAAANTNGTKYDGTGGSDYRRNFGSSADKMLGMKFSPSEDVVVKYLTLTLRKISSPSDKVVVRIETDNNGRPSGTLVSEQAVAISDQSLQTTQNTDYHARFKFGGNISLSKNTTYWIVLSKENGAVSATSYYQVYCKNGGTFAAGSLYTTTNGETWTTVETGNVKMSFYFNNSNNVSMDVPSGELVSEGASATFSAASYQSGWNYHTINFDQEATLIPNTIYWLVFENFRPVTDGNYWQIFCCEKSNWNMTNRPMTMPYLNIRLNEFQQWTIDPEGYYPRFRFDGERYDNGGKLDMIQGAYAGKDLTAVSPTAGVLTTSNIGRVTKRTLEATSNTFGSQFFFKAPKDGQITFLKDLNWVVRSYTYGGNYTPLATLTGNTAMSVNIEKGKLYHIVNGGTSQQDFTILLQ